MLPYPGYSWSFSQHMGKVSPRELFSLLAITYRYRYKSNYESLINKAIVDEKVLTANIRTDSGQVDAWRDYQQILAELGLIYSTRYEALPHLTPIGLAYIDGTIGYSELLSTQVLSYQYPNGHKTTISNSLKNKLLAANFSIPRSRVELDANSGVLVKPGVLILQILVELYRNREQPTLNTRECLFALVPTKTNNDW